MTVGDATTAQPWLVDALEQLDLRPHDRVLMIGASTTGQARAVARAIGDGELLILEQDAGRADALRRDGSEVILYQPQGGERFGMFDAALACPFSMGDWTANSLAEIGSSNLRLGGRLVLSLPAERFCEELSSAFQSLGGDPEQLQGWIGPSRSDAEESLQKAGLRNIGTATTAHITPFESAEHAARVLCSACEREELREDLALVLAQRWKTTGKSEVVIHRLLVWSQR